MIPSHYSDRYVIQRYNKALQIVQHLPANSTFQPAREEKLELYGYYKQVTHGDVNTPRPGIFDVVGRAKWDAWKKLEGVSRMEARHCYSETLLRAATEAYKRNAGRATAEQIIHAFALMQQQSADHDSEEDDITTTDDDMVIQEDGDESSSADERAYPSQIQASSSLSKRRRRPLSRQQQRSWYETSNASTPTPDRLRTTAAAASSTSTTPRQRPSSDDNDDKRLQTQSPRQRAALVGRMSSFQLSPAYSSSSSVTARPTIRPVQASHSSSSRATPELSSILLGPVTQRALESLQAEVVALNERIDDLRKELVVKDQQRAAVAKEAATTTAPTLGHNTNNHGIRTGRRPTGAAAAAAVNSGSSDDDNDIPDDWRWVIKTATKHAAVNLLTVTVLFLILHRRGSPIAYAITDQVAKLWRSVKQRALSQVIV